MSAVLTMVTHGFKVLIDTQNSSITLPVLPLYAFLTMLEFATVMFALLSLILWVTFNYAKTSRSIEIRILCVMVWHSTKKNAVFATKMFLIMTPYILLSFILQPIILTFEGTALLILVGVSTSIYLALKMMTDKTVQEILDRAYKTWDTLRVDRIIVTERHRDRNRSIENTLRIAATRYQWLSSSIAFLMVSIIVITIMGFVVFSVVFQLGGEGIFWIVLTTSIGSILLLPVQIIRLIQLVRKRDAKCSGYLQDIRNGIQYITQE